MLYSLLDQRRTRLLEIINQAQQDIDDAPEGRLSISTIGGSRRYYWKCPEQKPLYIGRQRQGIAALLAQKRYAQKAKAEAQKELRAVENMLNSLAGFNPKINWATKAPHPDSQLSVLANVYSNLPEARKELISPYVISNHAYACAWEKQAHESYLLHESGRTFKTEKGDLVRSKSEVIIADKLFRAGIPYKYEQPFEASGQLFFPDFIVLKPSTREEIYWEHFGLMDDPDYLQKCLKKLSLYASEGILPGHGLIVTFESLRSPLDIQLVDKTIELIIEQ